jgi:hypothetical protein
MTFMISHHGKRFDKDLGAEMDDLPRPIDSLNPTEGWQRVPPQSCA